jgi:hypothetical protein
VSSKVALETIKELFVRLKCSSMWDEKEAEECAKRLVQSATKVSLQMFKKLLCLVTKGEICICKPGISLSLVYRCADVWRA